jgi:hypothetical protein
MGLKQKNEKLRQAVRGALARAGVANPDSYSDKEVNTLIKDFKITSQNVTSKSVGARMEVKDGKLQIAKKRSGDIISRQIEQLEDFEPLTGMSFAQHANVQNVNQAYGHDIFQAIKDRGITQYDISSGEYVDPETGEVSNLSSLII